MIRKEDSVRDRKREREDYLDQGVGVDLLQIDAMKYWLAKWSRINEARRHKRKQYEWH